MGKFMCEKCGAYKTEDCICSDKPKGLNVSVKISDSDLFKEILSYLNELDERYPEAEISARMAEIASKYK